MKPRATLEAEWRLPPFCAESNIIMATLLDEERWATSNAGYCKGVDEVPCSLLRHHDLLGSQVQDLYGVSYPHAECRLPCPNFSRPQYGQALQFGFIKYSLFGTSAPLSPDLPSPYALRGRRGAKASGLGRKERCHLSSKSRETTASRSIRPLIPARGPAIDWQSGSVRRPREPLVPQPSQPTV
jgi:hypothetical protein